MFYYENYFSSNKKMLLKVWTSNRQKKAFICIEQHEQNNFDTIIQKGMFNFYSFIDLIS